MRLVALVTLWLWLCWPAPARADSDGYYCNGPGFVAWETRLGIGTPDHVLHIVRFSQQAGIAATEHIVLPDFQVHGMSCNAGRVELVGWSSRYRVNVTIPNNPGVSSESVPYDATKSPPPGSLGAGAREGVTDLEANGQTGTFELVVARVSRHVRGGIDHHVVARLVHRDSSPGLRIIASRVLMEGIYRETVDEE